jgi:hypothetical protein
MPFKFLKYYIGRPFFLPFWDVFFIEIIFIYVYNKSSKNINKTL